MGLVVSTVRFLFDLMGKTPFCSVPALSSSLVSPPLSPANTASVMARRSCPFSTPCLFAKDPTR